MESTPRGAAEGALAIAPEPDRLAISTEGRTRPGRGGLSSRRGRVLRLMLVAADVVGATTGSAVAALAAGLPAGSAAEFGLLCALGWVAAAFVLGLYPAEALTQWVSGARDLPRILLGALLLSWPMFAIASALDITHPVAAAFLAVVGAAAASALSRAGVRGLLHRSPPLYQPTVIVGSGVVAGQLIDKLSSHRELGLDVIGMVDDESDPINGPQVPILGRLDELPDILRTQNVTRAIFAFSRAHHEQLLEAIRTCRDHGVAVDIVPRLFECLDGARAVHEVGGLPLLSISPPGLARSSRAAKRLLDIVGSLVGLIVLAPLFALIAIAIKVESRGPVFFWQVRCGRKARRFRVLKFRSMSADAEQSKAELATINDLADGVMFKIRRDPRMTRVGHFLRRSSLDELPQLINVLRGQMSLVGPRPLIFPESEALADGWHARRLELRPGLTGPWQVRGRSEIGFSEMVSYDYQYVAGWSLARDLEILFLTLPAVLSRRGAY